MKAKAEGDADRISSCAAPCGDVSDGFKKKKKKNVRHISANLNLTPSTSQRKSAEAGAREYYCIVTKVLICQIYEGDLKAPYLPQMCLEIKG